jgi:very-short-patch-repair endonuclease
MTKPSKSSHLNLRELPYNPALKQRARILRKSGNLAEVLFWLAIKNKQLSGLDFDRQRIIGNYIVDFYCHKLALVIEIDGASHDCKDEYDHIRDVYLHSLELCVWHFSDTQVINKLPMLLDKIRQYPLHG